MTANPSRTSITDPLRIAELPLGAGCIGVTFCPGKRQPGAISGAWQRDLVADLDIVAQWGAQAVLCLVEAPELDALGVSDLPRVVQARGMAFHHLPIVDGAAPDARFEQAWPSLSRALRAALRQGGRVLVHCRGGLGRAGTVAAALLIEEGMAADAAMAAVRAARSPAAIETAVQAAWLRALAARGRYAGCLLGGAVGDALGAPVEFLSRGEIRARFGLGGIRDMAPAFGRVGAITDDTQMTLFTAEGLLRAHMRHADRGLCNPLAVVANAYSRWLHTQGVRGDDPPFGDPGWLIGHDDLHKRRAPGSTCLAALKAQRVPGEAARNGSKGCGGVMRVAPVGLFGHAFGDGASLAETFDLASASAGLTHGHPTGQWTAGVLAVMVRVLADGAGLDEALTAAVACLRGKPDHAETLRALAAAQRLAADGTPREAALDQLGEGWVAEEALAIAVYCALVAEDFEDGIVLAVNHDGDSDSTGAIAGHLLGTLHGAAAIPPRWLAPLELRAVIEEIAGDLFDCPRWRVGDGGADTAGLWRKYPPH